MKRELLLVPLVALSTGLSRAFAGSGSVTQT
jgi:hypothetical protein